MLAHQIAPGRTITYDGHTYRMIERWSRDGLSTNAVDIHTGLGASFGPLVDLTICADPGDELHHACARCGERQPVSALTRRETQDYDWDNPDQDVQGSVLRTVVTWQCADRAACADRRRERAALVNAEAEAADAAARESGYGVIGGPARGR